MANTDVSESILPMLTCHLKTSSCVWFHVCDTVVFLCSPLRFISSFEKLDLMSCFGRHLSVAQTLPMFWSLHGQ